MKLAVVASHPVQYESPFFAELARRPGIDLKVFYAWDTRGGSFDEGFRRDVSWDIPLLEGYAYEFVPNLSRRPGTHSFWGLVNPRLPSRLGRWGADAVLVNGYPYFTHLAAILSPGAPKLFRGDSTLLDRRSAWRRLAKEAALRFVFGRCDAFLYCGQRNHDYFRHYGVAERKLFHCPHAVDNTRFSADDAVLRARAAEWRRELRIPSDHRVVLFAGKLQDKKKPLDLLEAFLKLPEASATLVFAGEGAQKPELERRAGGSRRVVFLPFQNQTAMPVVYRLGDVFCLPSAYDETWGLAVNEAMACGLPAVVSDKVGCAPDLVVPEVTGWIVPARDTGALRQALERALAADLGAMGAAARKRMDGWTVGRKADGVVRACRAVGGAA